MLLTHLTGLTLAHKLDLVGVSSQSQLKKATFFLVKPIPSENAASLKWHVAQKYINSNKALNR